MTISRSLLAAVFGIVFLAEPAAAQELVSASDPDGLVAAILAMGYQASLDKDGTGDPIIFSRANGGNFSIEFYGCSENKACKTLRFFAGYDLENGTTLDAVNAWNSEQRFASAFLDAEADPFLQMDVNTEGGISIKTLQTNLQAWEAQKRAFESHINFRRGGP
ncbi:MAG: YbjN domain-containing protein [Vicinamibacterales bacterium]